MNRIAMICAVALAISPVAVPKVRIDFDHAWDFSHYQTYQWSAPPDARALNQLMQERVVGFVEEAFAARKLRRVTNGGDLLVNLSVDVREEKVFNTFTNSTGFGWDWGWGSSVSTTTVEIMRLGTLTVNVVDRRKNQLIFQGISTGSISSRPQRNTKRLARAVNEIFERYPPK